MLRMQPFEVHLPSTADEAARMRAELPDSMYVAGGTDLLPNIKHGLFTPRHRPPHSAAQHRVAELGSVGSFSGVVTSIERYAVPGGGYCNTVGSRGRSPASLQATADAMLIASM